MVLIDLTFHAKDLTKDSDTFCSMSRNEWKRRIFSRLQYFPYTVYVRKVINKNKQKKRMKI